jgi:hypothetical protein
MRDLAWLTGKKGFAPFQARLYKEREHTSLLISAKLCIFLIFSARRSIYE